MRTIRTASEVRVCTLGSSGYTELDTSLNFDVSPCSDAVMDAMSHRKADNRMILRPVVSR